jgi:hypothetical protein
LPDTIEEKQKKKKGKKAPTKATSRFNSAGNHDDDINKILLQTVKTADKRCIYYQAIPGAFSIKNRSK